MSNSRQTEYQRSADLLLQHLDSLLNSETGYPEEPSWGYAFTYLASLCDSRSPNTRLAKKALHHLARQNKTSSNYSWEFVVYAMQSAKRFASEPLPEALDCHRAKGTRMFNWFLLRRLNKRLCGCYSTTDHLKLFVASKLYQHPSGLILDEFQTRSLQYHAFCLFVLAELIDRDPDNTWLKQWFSKGIEFSMQRILSDGTSLYIGRGQEQIFGYGALIYSLEYCHINIRPLSEEKLNQVSKRLLSFQREDGSYPLVLRNREPEPVNSKFSEGPPGGWYGYNTLFDYQPFLAYCLKKTGNLQ